MLQFAYFPGPFAIPQPEKPCFRAVILSLHFYLRARRRRLILCPRSMGENMALRPCCFMTGTGRLPPHHFTVMRARKALRRDACGMWAVL